MKRSIPVVMILLLALLLTGCGAYTPIEPTPAPEPREDYAFTRADFPSIACAPSLEPLAEAAAAALLGVTRQEGLDYVRQSVSAQVWKALDSGESALALALGAEPPEGVRTVEVAKDALVFFVSGQNRVESLTKEQLVGIFTGKLTNWKELGGKDVEISVFTKTPVSGSQSALESLLLGGGKPSGGKTASVDGEEYAAPFDSSEGAIGFGFWYYEDVMGMAEDCRILAVDGTVPSAESIASGEYPFIVSCLAGVSEDAAEDSPEFILWQWLASSAGRRLTASQGYVSGN